MPFDAEISAEIWNAKYRFRSDGACGDEDVEATWARVAAAIAEAEPARARRHWRTQFESALSDFKLRNGARGFASSLLRLTGTTRFAQCESSTMSAAAMLEAMVICELGRECRKALRAGSASTV